MTPTQRIALRRILRENMNAIMRALRARKSATHPAVLYLQRERAALKKALGEE